MIMGHYQLMWNELKDLYNVASEAATKANLTKLQEFRLNMKSLL